MQVFNGADELKAAANTKVGAGEWITVEQSQIDLFADATDDHQWIHVDKEKAAAGPFGTTIAHGFLTLSLLPSLIKQVYRVEGVKMGINYGLNKVRFTSPVPVGSKIRAVVEFGDITEAGGGLQIVNKVTVELEGSERPALVAEWLTRQYF
ncbi:Acyl dehydratase [Pseudonocardia thermophila]|jgi:Acyl dehydratase|uniref:Acyl dehydratase n=1 Tax=Pseudonocardia thermophila TaxID=1848 RepID=A0A1M6UKD4_PSETH|nr:MaoC family dehydratase [Pseudonocardia thermophila]SHK69704.1 Acyl dehydratase [Pseudonocardia thermophila]